MIHPFSALPYTPEQAQRAHQICELIAYAAAFSLFLFLRKRWPRHLAGGGGPPTTFNQTLWILVGAVFGALFGARFLALAESFPTTLAHLADPRIYLQGKSIVGAILGGWFGVETAKRFLRISHPSGDVYVFPLILGMCLGRVGCFLAGLHDHTVGLPSNLPFAVDFGDGPRHPTQLYEILFLSLTASFFIWRIKTRRQHGCMFSQFVFAYMLWRFAVEFIKPRATVPYLHLSPIQLASLAGILYSRLHWHDNCCTPAKEFRTQNSELRIPPDGLLELTTSLCPQCLESGNWTLDTGHSRVQAKVLLDSGRIYLQKFCPTHGQQKILIATDAPYWLAARRSHKPPTPPLRTNTPMQRGCPFDCGLCPDHEQHACLAILEITDACNLHCPVCYAASTPAGRHRSLPQIQSMLDTIIAAEGRLNILQISGGEPTLHPQFFEILDLIRTRPLPKLNLDPSVVPAPSPYSLSPNPSPAIRHLMLNTNGQRLADDPAFAARLATYMPAFEVYLQFDSLRPDTLIKLRGQDLTDLRRRALAALNHHKISTTLVVTVAKGLNDDQLGEIIDFATTQPCVRGVTFQPIQLAGRLALTNTDGVPCFHRDVGGDRGGSMPLDSRLTLTEVRTQILAQQNLFTPADLLPVPCHPDALAMAYALRHKNRLTPLSKFINPQTLLDLAGNTIAFEQDPALRKNLHHLFSAAASPAAAAASLSALCCTPALTKLGKLNYDHIFRIIIMSFMDAHSLDLRSLKRSCVHIIHPDGRLIPFDTYNILYRQQLESSESRFVLAH